MPVGSRLATFIGTWRGRGQGTLPAMAPFAYEEEIRFEDLGGDVAYSQRAWDPESGRVRHAEAGIWRVMENDVLVAAFASPRRRRWPKGRSARGRPYWSRRIPQPPRERSG